MDEPRDKYHIEFGMKEPRDKYHIEFGMNEPRDKYHIEFGMNEPRDKYHRVGYGWAQGLISHWVGLMTNWPFMCVLQLQFFHIIKIVYFKQCVFIRATFVLSQILAFGLYLFRVAVFKKIIYVHKNIMDIHR